MLEHIKVEIKPEMIIEAVKKMTKKEIMELLKRSVDFEETVTETRKCKCGGTITRHIRMEPNQTKRGRWYVETCDGEDCKELGKGKGWDCGWT